MDEDEDLWHLYNLLARGDRVTALTSRKVQKTGAVGSSGTDRIKMNLQVEVERIDFDPTTSKLRLSGRIVSDPTSQFVKSGQYHTFQFNNQSQLTLSKHTWDSMHLEMLKEASDVTSKADLAAVVMQEGLANVCLVTSHMTVVRQRIELTIPRKRRAGASAHDKALEKFFSQIAQAMLQHIPWDAVKCVLIASPGFVRTKFIEFAVSKFPDLAVYKDRLVPCRTSSGHKGALEEVLQDPAVMKRVGDTKASAEVKALSDFHHMLLSDPQRAFYGYPHVRAAADAQAIQVLLVTDELFRNARDPQARKRYVQLVEDVRAAGGEAFVLSTMHVSGEQLKSLTGVAAILRYALPDLEDMPMSSDDHLADDLSASDQQHPFFEGGDSFMLDDSAVDGGDDAFSSSSASSAYTPTTTSATTETIIEYEDSLSETNTDDALSDRDDDFLDEI
jgi:protein pelota